MKQALNFPEIVTLCGSTRFFREFRRQEFQLTMEGKIVLSVGFFHHESAAVHGQNIGITPSDKVRLDELHKRKIDLCDQVFVLNVGGYIGESTRSEIEYARKLRKPVRFLEGEQVHEAGA